MFQLVVGQNVKLSFDAADLRSTGCGLPSVIEGLCALGTVRGVGLFAPVSSDVQGVLAELGGGNVHFPCYANRPLGSATAVGCDQGLSCEYRVACGEGNSLGSSVVDGRCGEHATTQDVDGNPVLYVGLGGRGVEGSLLCGDGAIGEGKVEGFGRSGGGAVSETVSQVDVPVMRTCMAKNQFNTKTEFNRHRRKERKERLKVRKKEEEKTKTQNQNLTGEGEMVSGLSVGSNDSQIDGLEEKNKKNKKIIPEWRRKSVVGQASKEVRAGYFSDLSEDVQRELKDSRAKLLIEKNKRELRQEQEKLKSLDCESPEYLVRKMIEVTALANVLKKKTTDDRVGGWAETVADSLTKSVAASAPSSVPSLESVGYGKSSLEASVGSASVREAEFLKEKDLLENHYLKADSFLPSDYKADLDDLKQQYADVLYEPAIAKRVTAYKTACDLMRSEAFDEKTSMGMARGISKEFEDVIVMFENSGYGDILS